MSGIVADSAGLVQEHWAHDFSIGSGLVFDKVAGIFSFRTSGITTHLTEGCRGDDGTGGGGQGYYTPKAVSVFDIKTNPVQNLETRLPLPTITGLILGEIGRLVKEPPDRKAQRKIPLFTTVHRKHLMIEE